MDSHDLAANANLTRRDVLTRALPAAAVLGAGLFALPAQAQTPAGRLGLAGRMQAEAYKVGQYTLPKLTYASNALGPHLDARTLEIHHDKHHKAYVDGLNKTIKSIADLRQSADIDPARLAGLERDLSFNAGGHLLHTLYWFTMAPGAGGEPKGALAEALTASFGSFAAFKNYFSKVAAGIKGSGWALLVWEPVGGTLGVCAVNEHDAHLIPGAAVLLPLDVWEHAYYLKYQNVRADYVAAWWNVVNWAAVGQSFEALRDQRAALQKTLGNL